MPFTPAPSFGFVSPPMPFTTPAFTFGTTTIPGQTQNTSAFGMQTPIYGANSYNPSALSQQFGNSNIYGAPQPPQGTMQYPNGFGNQAPVFGMQYGSNAQYGIPTMQQMSAKPPQAQPFAQAPFGAPMMANFGTGSVFTNPQQQQQQQKAQVFSASNQF